MAGPSRKAVHTAGRAALVGLFVVPVVSFLAAAVPPQDGCDGYLGRRWRALELFGEQRFEVPTAEALSGMRMDLRYDGDSGCVWGHGMKALAWAEIWLDRSRDGGRTWEPRLGVRRFVDGSYVGSYPLDGEWIRLCGNAPSTPEVACTAWFGKEVGCVPKPVERTPGEASLVIDGGFEQQSCRGLSGPWRAEGPDFHGVDFETYDLACCHRSGIKNATINTVWSDPGSRAENAIVQGVRVEPGTAYELSAYLRTSDNVTDGFLGARNTDGHPVARVGYRASSDYQRVSTRFTIGSQTELETFVGYRAPGAESWMQVDDVSLVEIS